MLLRRVACRSCSRLMRRSASMVAFSTLCGLFVPSVLVRMSWMPTASSTGRTAPPAMTPVPGTAGLRNTRPAPKCPVISMGIVVSRRGTKIRSFFACSTALRMASGTSWALPRPTPTWPRPSPTTTSAVNEKRRPPLTTFATRLIETTRSFSSCTLGSILVYATRSPPAPLEGEAAGARGIRQRLHPAVVLIATAIEDDALDAGRLRLVGQQRADGLGSGDVATRLVLCEERLAAAVHRQHRAPGVVVDQLRVDVTEAPEHGQPRAPRRAPQVASKPVVPLVPWTPPVARDHFAPAFLPTLRRTYSPEYRMPLPLYGSGLRSARSLAAVSPSSALSAPLSGIAVCLSISAVMPAGRGKITGCREAGAP